MWLKTVFKKGQQERSQRVFVGVCRYRCVCMLLFFYLRKDQFEFYTLNVISFEK